MTSAYPAITDCAHIAQRKKDKDFQEGLRTRIERAQRMLDKRQP
jgi:hypothetical protein